MAESTSPGPEVISTSAGRNSSAAGRVGTVTGHHINLGKLDLARMGPEKYKAQRLTFEPAMGPIGDDD